jgi:hypothetical protein
MPRRTTTLSTEVSDWIEAQCAHVKGEWAGQKLKLEAWQSVEIIDPLFSTRNPDGRRQYRTALIGIPRKAGKSTLGAALALRLLFKDSEPGAEVYSAAADREQARIVFEIAKGMVEANPGMSKRAKVYRNSIVVPHTASTYEPGTVGRAHDWAGRAAAAVDDRDHHRRVRPGVDLLGTVRLRPEDRIRPARRPDVLLPVVGGP